jgi:hypothetical protein
MAQHGRRKPSRWLYFVLSIGSLVASGIYIGTAAAQGFPTGRILRAVMFGLLGIFWTLMYGESRPKKISREE